MTPITAHIPLTRPSHGANLTTGEAGKYRGTCKHQWVSVVSVTILKAVTKSIKITLEELPLRILSTHKIVYLYSGWKIATFIILDNTWPGEKLMSKKDTEGQQRKQQIHISVLMFTERAVIPYMVWRQLSQQMCIFMRLHYNREKWGIMVASFFFLIWEIMAYFISYLIELLLENILNTIIPELLAFITEDRECAISWIVAISSFQRKHSLMESGLACRHS